MARLAALALILAGLLAPTSLRAHAQLVAADPAAGNVLAAAPAEIHLMFSEPVRPLALRWVGPDGGARDVTGRPEGAVLAVPVPAGPARGTHLLSWRVVSIDGHPVGGTYALSFGAATGMPEVAAEVDAAARTAAARFALTVALVFGVGGAVFSRLVDPGAAAPAWTRRLAAAAALAALPAAAVLVGACGLDLTGLPPAALATPAPWRAALGARLGVTAGLSAAAALAALAALARGEGRSVAAVAWMLAAASFAASGHAATAAPIWLTAPAMATHALALLFWLGALAPLAAGARAGTPDLADLLRRFSALAVPLVALLVASGTALAAVQLGAVSALPATAYGRLLLAKLALVALMLGLAAMNRLRLSPAVAAGRPGAARALTSTVRAELALGLVVLALASAFRLTPPPRALSRAAPETVQVHLHGPDAMAVVSVAPGQAGANRVEVRLLDAAGAALAPAEVSVGFAMPAAGIERLRLPATPAPDGLWRAGPAVLQPPGKWAVEVDVLIDDFTRARLSGEVSIGR